MGRGFFVWGGSWGLSAEDAKLRLLKARSVCRKKFLIYAFPQKISSISQKFLMTFFFYFFLFITFFFFLFFFFFFLVIDLFYVLICFLSMLQLEQNFGGAKSFL